MVIQRTSLLVSLLGRHLRCVFGTRADRSLVSTGSLRPVLKQLSASPSSLFHSSAASCSSSGHRHDLMSFPRILYPSYWNFLKGLFSAHAIIRPYMDANFSSDTIMLGSRQAMVAIAGCLHEGRLADLSTLVSAQALEEIRSRHAFLPDKVKERLSFGAEHIGCSFVYETGVMIEGEGENQKRWVEVTVCAYIHPMFAVDRTLMGLSKIPVTDMLIGNIRVIREYTKHVEDSWNVNVINFFLPTND